MFPDIRQTQTIADKFKALMELTWPPEPAIGVKAYRALSRFEGEIWHPRVFEIVLDESPFTYTDDLYFDPMTGVNIYQAVIQLLEHYHALVIGE